MVNARRTKQKNDWQKVHVDRINLTVPKGRKEIIQNHAQAHGESVNGFINRAITETMARDQEKDAGDQRIAPIAAESSKTTEVVENEELEEAALKILERIVPSIRKLYHIERQRQSMPDEPGPHLIDLPCSLGDMLIYRTDVTANLICDNAGLVDEYIRILKKSMVLPLYKLDWFREGENKAKDCRSANRHSHKQYCKSAAFFVYDKTAELEMIDRFPGSLIGKKVLRIEAQLRRKALRKWLPNREIGNNWEIIRNIYKNRVKIINWYLKRIQPTGKYVRYKDAVDLIENAKFKKKTRDRMSDVAS